MSVLFQTVINTGKLCVLRKASLKSFFHKFIIKRNYSDSSATKFETFNEVVNKRRAEARRSIVVQVNSESSFNELYNYCSKYATINGTHHYKNPNGEHFMLVEFCSEEEQQEVLRNCSAHQRDLDVMALPSPFLWFKAVSRKKEKLVPVPATLLIQNGSTPINDDDLIAELGKCETMSDQIQLLYDKTKLNDLGVHLRYMVARQLEMAFSSLYANVVVHPFGSSINGFGKMGCDLDLVLTNILTHEMTDPNKRLVYHEKKCEGGRSPWQRHLELVGELLSLRVAGAGAVQRVLHARVPILKMQHGLAGVDCDICYNNISGVYMSELLWLYGSLDPRVRPLTFVIRRWAKTVGLTNQHPGRWITNFPLTLMVLFFLQQKTKEGRVLPPLKTLVKYAGKEDVRLGEENLNCTFLRSLDKLPPQEYGGGGNLATLLLQFFEFYAQFEWSEQAISLADGVALRKPNALPLYVVNPLEPALNVSRNVSHDECERLKLEVRNAAWHLDAGFDNKSDDWGIIGLIEQRSTRGLKKLLRVGNSHRLVSMKDLFSDELNELKEESVKDTKKRSNNKSDAEVEKNVEEMKRDMTQEKENKEQKIKYKNSQIAKEVYRIRRDKM